MRRLILMRHAKSDWHTGQQDHSRPLNRRGQRDAPRVASELASLGWVPEAVLSSDSQRTTETWARMARALGAMDVPVHHTRNLYLAGLGALQQEIARVPDDVRTVLALGHNPGWENAASVLGGAPVHMTTANAVLLELDALPWARALEAPARRLVAVLRPKELG